MDPSLLPRVPPPPPVRWTGRQPGATSGGYSTTPNYPSAAPVDGNYKQTPYHGGGGYSNRASGAAGGTCGGCDQQQSSSFCGREQYDNENYNTVGKGADQRDSWGFGSRSGTANYDNYHYNSGYGRADGTTGSATTTHFQGKNKNNDYSYNNGPSYNTNGNSNYYNSSYGRRDNSAHPAGQHRGTATMKGSSTTTTDNWTKGSSNPTTCTSAPPINLDTTHINGTKTLLVDGEPFARDDFDTAAWCTRSSFNKIMHNRSSNFDYHYNLGLKSSGILTTTPCNYDTIGGGGRDRENGKTGGKNQGGKFNKFNDTKGLTDNYKGGIPLNPLLGKRKPNRSALIQREQRKRSGRTEEQRFRRKASFLCHQENECDHFDSRCRLEGT
ncbi:unnamed protein product [Amoebophrya sp. A25]|nr:unnamed protein product [Amoebophrya sp. A25]|eukprot:GSA25T00009165001.1